MTGQTKMARFLIDKVCKANSTMTHKESVAEDEDIAIEATVDVGEMDLDQGTHAIARGPEILAGLPSLSETEYHFK